LAQLQVGAGQYEQAAQMLGLALHHPSSWSEVENDAQPVLAALGKALPAGQLEAALARGAELDLEQVVGEILAGSEVAPGS
jgi:hypothetical protein